MGRSRVTVTALLAAAFFLCAAAAFADVAIPSLAYIWPAAWLLLLPVILLEGLVARRVLKTSLKRSLVISAAANFSSTFTGIPVAWFVMFVAGMAVGLVTRNVGQSWPLWVWRLLGIALGATWVGEVPSWEIVGGAMSLCIPFYFASVWIEARVAKRYLPAEAAAAASSWSWRANLLSYALIEAALAVLLVWALK